MKDKALERDIRAWKSETERIIDALTEKVEELEKDNAKQEDENSDLQEACDAKDKYIEELNKQLRDLSSF